MQRRTFLIGLFAVTATVAACGRPPGAEAAPLPVQPLDPGPEPARAEMQSAVADDGDLAAAHVQPVWHRRWHRPRGRAWGLRRRYWGPRYYYRPRRRYWRRRRYW